MAPKLDNHQASKPEYLFFLAVFFVISYLLYQVFQPLMGPIIFGAIIAGSCLPLFRYTRAKFKWSDNKAAIISASAVTLLILIPMILMSIQVTKETVSFLDGVKTYLESDKFQAFLDSNNFLMNTLRRMADIFGIELEWDALKSQVLGFGQNLSGSVLKTFNKVVGNLFKFLFDFAITILTVYTLLAQGESLKKYIFKLSPLSDSDEQKLLDTFNQMNYVSLICNGVGGVIQGGVAGFMFLILGIKSPIMWTSLMIILAFIPLLGISIITIPASLYFLLSGHYVSGISLLVVSLGIAFWTENIFKPKFIGDRIRINSIFVLFTIIGGMAIYGVSGVFYGPLIGILFLTIVTIYQERYS